MKLLNILKNLVSRLGGVETKVSNLETDYIVEQGTSGIWTYRKWNSGISECWGTFTESRTHYTTWNGFYMYYSSAVYFPMNLFVAVPTCHYDFAISDNAWCIPVKVGDGRVEITRIRTMYGATEMSGTRTCSFDIICKGRWK